ncbi:hypothetical protein J2T13_005018 [Paenibacillus sp. DS2015]|uniref:DUF4176 domain-containing protein n=1 Tax=Paenibacillus sp. DS2015 TaxID=3373917 RepID=UPI003D263829
MGNEEQYKGLLPLGSVVLLKGAYKKLMVYGRKQVHIDSNKVYDYLGVVFPEGYIDPDYSFLFNHEDIEVVKYVGYINDEEKDFQRLLENVSSVEE